MPDVLTILAIDDNEDDRLLYRRALRTDGAISYNMIEANNGEAGLLAIKEKKPDCVLLDYSLPGHNGIEVLKRIRADYPFLPVLMLTGQGNESVAVAAMLEGAQHYLSKSSITSENLQRSIRLAIDHCVLQERVHDQRTSLELFTRALAHDLKEPVRTIRSFLDLIARQNLPPEKTQKYFDYIQQAAERMGGLIDTVYFYIRLDSPEQKIGCETCDSDQAAHAALENLAALIKERHATVTVESLPNVSANRIQLIQVFQNLIGNAIHHCETDPVIHVSAQPVPTGWCFRVMDNGPGVAAENVQSIFQPFKRLTHRHSDGLGMGLAICKKIVESHGGVLNYEPALPHGACFSFTMKGAECEWSLQEQRMQKVAEYVHENTAGKMANILIVDDNDADIELMRFALMDEQKLQCHLSISHDGQEAMEQIARKLAVQDRFDLILLDINMPGMDGFSCLSHIRNEAFYRDVPVVMCSTSNDDKDFDQAKHGGANGYIIKPFHFDRLRALLADCSGLYLYDKDAVKYLLRA